jgi:hypothetical protein
VFSALGARKAHDQLICNFAHYSGGTNFNYKQTVGPFIHASTERGVAFIGVYVQGAEKPDGAPGWNTGSESVPGAAADIDDAQFLVDILALFTSRFLWTGRAFAFGSSNGAAMAQKAAVNGALGFAGIAAAATQLLLIPEQGGPAVGGARGLVTFF